MKLENLFVYLRPYVGTYVREVDSEQKFNNFLSIKCENPHCELIFQYLTFEQLCDILCGDSNNQIQLCFLLNALRRSLVSL
jgi:hypothetical protein